MIKLIIVGLIIAVITLAAEYFILRPAIEAAAKERPPGPAQDGGKT